MSRCTNKTSANEQPRWTRSNQGHDDQTNTEDNHWVHHNTEHDCLCDPGTRPPDESDPIETNNCDVGLESAEGTRITLPRRRSDSQWNSWWLTSVYSEANEEVPTTIPRARRWWGTSRLIRVSKMFRWMMWRRLHSASACIFWLWGTPRTQGYICTVRRIRQDSARKYVWHLYWQENCPVMYINLLHIFSIFHHILSKNTSGYVRLFNDCVCMILWTCGCVHYILGFNLQFSRQQRVQCKQ